ncbi:MAG: penicillin acylase family protein [Anaerolineae bacterium]|nr:penicillin acylase family protein [Anaerolineae bacterium]
MVWWQSLVGYIARLSMTWFSRRRLPTVDGERHVNGLEKPVDVLRDRWGVPHIYAATERDLFFAQGFVHAQDRLWQMDFNRRLVAGRLAEVLGDRALQADRWLRTLRMRHVAEQEAAALPAEMRSLLEAYAAGVNAGIAEERLPLEFLLLRYRPEPWEPVDSISWGKMMSWSLSVNWEAELLRQRLIDRIGAERAAELEPDNLDRCPFIIPQDIDAGCAGGRSAGDTALSRADAARPFTGPSALDGVGSNCWAIGPERSATGAPLLANDMHLGLELPAIWYENHLVAGDVNLTGITFPGVPGIVSGHNGHVAWGFTNGFSDVQDLYIERLRRTDDGRVQVVYRGAWEEAEVVHEEIRVRGGETVTEEVIVTRHGPVINSLAGDLAGDAPLALRWTSLEPDALMWALYRMNHATDCNDFREALRLWSAPIQNVTYADTQGNVAYSLPGKIPIRAKGDGRVPVPGWDGAYEWERYIPFDELPHVLNPPTGYVVNANNRVVNDSYPHWLGNDYCIGDRAQRIVELITAQSQAGLADVERIHVDQLSPHARNMARFLGSLPVDGKDPEMDAVVRLMRGWDGTLSAGSPAAAIYEVFVREMIRLLLAPRIGDLAVRVAGKGPTPGLQGGSMFGERSWEWLERVLQEPDGFWFEGCEGRDACTREALRRTISFLRDELGGEMQAWSWGKLHTLTLHHRLGAVSPLDRVLNRGPYPLGGDGGTVWATGSGRDSVEGQHVVGPVYRMIVDLRDLRRSRSVLLPGQSGRLGSPHYADQIDAWFEGAYHPMLYTREDVGVATVHKLRLVP